MQILCKTVPILVPFVPNKQKKNPRNDLSKPFLGTKDVAGAEGLEPSARGFGATELTFLFVLYLVLSFFIVKCAINNKSKTVSI